MVHLSGCSAVSCHLTVYTKFRTPSLALKHLTLRSPETYATALDLAVRHRHHLFDTLYHAVALHTPGAVLVTADERYYNKARLEGQIALLADCASV